MSGTTTINPKPNLLGNVRIYFKEYCQKTTIHCLYYLGESGRNPFERCWWFLALAISFGLCFCAVYHTWQKWATSPLIVNMASRPTLISTIPFPSITICPEVKADKSKFNYTKVLHKKLDGIELTPQESVYFEHMSAMCEYRHDFAKSGSLTFSDDFFDTLDQIKPKFHIANCSFLMSNSLDCHSMFVPVLTEDGICYSFNILNRSNIFRDSVLAHKNYHNVAKTPSDWTVERGYLDDPHMDLYPYRAYLSGITKGMKLTLFTPPEDLDYACTDGVQGYKIILNKPTMIPRPSQRYFPLPLDGSVTAAVMPLMIVTSKSVAKYAATKRMCYFEDEKYLKYFKSYDESHCKLECLTNYTLLLCDCVNFFMPRENATKICGPQKMPCTKFAEGIMQYSDLEKKLHYLNRIQFPAHFHEDCDCLPLCTDLSYSSEVSQTVLDSHMWMLANRYSGLANRSFVSTLVFYFASDDFVTSHREELLGPLEFIANFGGLICLFSGISLLSIVELLYFLTIRIIFNVRHHQKWTGQRTHQ